MALSQCIYAMIFSISVTILQHVTVSRLLTERRTHRLRLACGKTQQSSCTRNLETYTNKYPARMEHKCYPTSYSQACQCFIRPYTIRKRNLPCAQTEPVMPGGFDPFLISLVAHINLHFHLFVNREARHTPSNDLHRECDLDLALTT